MFDKMSINEPSSLFTADGSKIQVSRPFVDIPFFFPHLVLISVERMAEVDLDGVASGMMKGKYIISSSQYYYLSEFIYRKK